MRNSSSLYFKNGWQEPVLKQLTYKLVRENFLAYRSFKYSFVAKLKNFRLANKIIQDFLSFINRLIISAFKIMYVSTFLSVIEQGKGLYFTQSTLNFPARKWNRTHFLRLTIESSKLNFTVNIRKIEFSFNEFQIFPLKHFFLLQKYTAFDYMFSTKDAQLIGLTRSTSSRNCRFEEYDNTICCTALFRKFDYRKIDGKILYSCCE